MSPLSASKLFAFVLACVLCGLRTHIRNADLHRNCCSGDLMGFIGALGTGPTTFWCALCLLLCPATVDSPILYLADFRCLL